MAPARCSGRCDSASYESGGLLNALLKILLAFSLILGVTACTNSEESESSVSEVEAQDNTFVVPDLVGMNLQDAQDQLQELGSYALDQEDALGYDRVQILDSDWTVCRQSPEPGTTSSVDATVTLWSAKIGEDCNPDSAPSGSSSPEASGDQETEAKPTVDSFEMPNLVGMNLQDAQDQLQALGSYVLDQEDALYDRVQILDSGWTVCRQSPEPGTMTLLLATVTLWSVKIGEDCP